MGFDYRHLGLSLLLKGMTLGFREIGESFLEMLLIENRDRKRPDTATITALTAGYLLEKGCRGSLKPPGSFFSERGA